MRTNTYWGWLAHMEAGTDVVSVTLTAGARHNGPESGREFFESVLQAAGCDAPLEAWGVDPLITNYFSGHDWQRCWELRLLLAEKQPRSTLSRGPFEVNIAPATELAEPSRIPVQVLADFVDRARALRCRNALKEHAAAARWDDVHLAGYRVRQLSPTSFQLVIDVATVTPDDMNKVTAAAADAIRIAESHGGITRAAADGTLPSPPSTS